jgi:catechol 2,3-dioxygenase-like lactoylglutathione lyase family enzyme
MTTPSARVQALGVFLASEDPGRLTAWYRALGVPLGDESYCFVGGDGTPGSGSIFSVMPAAAPLPAAPADAIAAEPYGQRRVTLNLRVDDLDATLAGLRARGTKVAGPTDAGYGIFAWAHDPDGNVVELWMAAKAPP